MGGDPARRESSGPGARPDAPRRELPGSVLFACTHNAIRSPMAEGLMKHYYGHRVYVDSVGVRALPVDPFAVAVMAELGIDISRHRSKTFRDLEDTSYDLVITLSPEAQHQAVEMTRTMACDVVFWHTFDPTAVDGSRETRMEAYREVRDTLLKRILDYFALPPPPRV